MRLLAKEVLYETLESEEYGGILFTDGKVATGITCTILNAMQLYHEYLEKCAEVEKVWNKTPIGERANRFGHPESEMDYDKSFNDQTLTSKFQIFKQCRFKGLI